MMIKTSLVSRFRFETISHLQHTYSVPVTPSAAGRSEISRQCSRRTSAFCRAKAPETREEFLSRGLTLLIDDENFSLKFFADGDFSTICELMLELDSD